MNETLEKLLTYFRTLTCGHKLFLVTKRTRSQIQVLEMGFLLLADWVPLRDRVMSLVMLEGFKAELPLLHTERGQLRWFRHLTRRWS